jgi:hypothetical protein
METSKEEKLQRQKKKGWPDELPFPWVLALFGQ